MRFVYYKVRCYKTRGQLILATGLDIEKLDVKRKFLFMKSKKTILQSEGSNNNKIKTENRHCFSNMPIAEGQNSEGTFSKILMVRGV